jgi:hypothetical protein
LTKKGEGGALSFSNRHRNDLPTNQSVQVRETPL